MAAQAITFQRIRAAGAVGFIDTSPCQHQNVLLELSASILVGGVFWSDRVFVGLAFVQVPEESPLREAQYCLCWVLLELTAYDREGLC